MATLEYSRVKAENDARTAEQARQDQLRRSALVLILSHLQIQGFSKSLATLEAESGVSLERYELCDNIDLLTVIQEYESYYSIKFSRAPKIVKKVGFYRSHFADGEGQGGL
jgi:katanin p60 ATPase-containing subunit A1